MSISEYRAFISVKKIVSSRIHSATMSVARKIRQLFGKTLTDFSGKSAVFEQLKILFFLNMTVRINSEKLGAPVQNNFRC